MGCKDPLKDNGLLVPLGKPKDWLSFGALGAFSSGFSFVTRECPFL